MVLVEDLRLYTPQDAKTWHADFLNQHQLNDTPYAVFAPTAAWLSKRWPIDNFIQLAKHLPEHNIQNLIILGGPGEESQTAPLINADLPNINTIDLTAKSTVGQMMAIIENAQLVICNDSAAAHIATGFGRRMVCIFGPTEPAKVSPRGYDDYVASPDNKPDIHYRKGNLDQSIIAQVTLEQVLEKLQLAMSNEPPNPDQSNPESDG